MPQTSLTRLANALYYSQIYWSIPADCRGFKLLEPSHWFWLSGNLQELWSHRSPWPRQMIMATTLIWSALTTSLALGLCSFTSKQTRKQLTKTQLTKTQLENSFLTLTVWHFSGQIRMNIYNDILSCERHTSRRQTSQLWMPLSTTALENSGTGFGTSGLRMD